MKSPEERLLEADMGSVGYLAGLAQGRWGLTGAEAMPDGAAWPRAYFWMAAAARPNSPDRYHVTLDLAGYRGNPPTGTFWDPVERGTLPFASFPKGKADSRFAKVFRTDWGESSRAFYHPYDRVAADTHAQWRMEMPQLVWTLNHTIVDYLDEFQTLLMSEDYLGR